MRGARESAIVTPQVSGGGQPPARRTLPPTRSLAILNLHRIRTFQGYVHWTRVPLPTPSTTSGSDNRYRGGGGPAAALRHGRPGRGWEAESTAPTHLPHSASLQL